MKQTRILMDMPVTVEIAESSVTPEPFDTVYDYFTYIDNTFSPFKKDSELTAINEKRIPRDAWSRDMKTIFNLAEETKKQSGGYFDIRHNGTYDPCGIVKGWAIYRAAGLLKGMGFRNYYIEAGGDIQTSGVNENGKPWRIGIRNPFRTAGIIKVLAVSDLGIATSGTYERGKHIYNPMEGNDSAEEIVSLTVIGPDIYEADRFATAAFAMGKPGIRFIGGLKRFEGYMIDRNGMATYTSGFMKYCMENG